MNRSTFFIIVQDHSLEAAALFSTVLADKTGGIYHRQLSEGESYNYLEPFLTLPFSTIVWYQNKQKEELTHSQCN